MVNVASKGPEPPGQIGSAKANESEPSDEGSKYISDEVKTGTLLEFRDQWQRVLQSGCRDLRPRGGASAEQAQTRNL